MLDYFYKSFLIKLLKHLWQQMKMKKFTIYMSLNWHRSHLQKPLLKTANFCDVMIKTDWMFVFIWNNKNKVFPTTVLTPCDSENTSNKLLKVWFYSVLISKISLPLTVWSFLFWMIKSEMHKEHSIITTQIKVLNKSFSNTKAKHSMLKDHAK